MNKFSLFLSESYPIGLILSTPLSGIQRIAFRYIHCRNVFLAYLFFVVWSQKNKKEEAEEEECKKEAKDEEDKKEKKKEREGFCPLLSYNLNPAPHFA